MNSENEQVRGQNSWQLRRTASTSWHWPYGLLLCTPHSVFQRDTSWPLCFNCTPYSRINTDTGATHRSHTVHINQACPVDARTPPQFACRIITVYSLIVPTQMWFGRLRNLNSRLADTWLCYQLTKGKRISRECEAQGNILHKYIWTGFQVITEHFDITDNDRSWKMKKITQ
jgi:hypothetical protein